MVRGPRKNNTTETAKKHIGRGSTSEVEGEGPEKFAEKRSRNVNKSRQGDLQKKSGRSKRSLAFQRSATESFGPVAGRKKVVI